MAINQSQNGVDDEIEVPQELFANERFKLGKKGRITLVIIICRGDNEGMSYW